jgi:hypothetical protein
MMDIFTALTLILAGFLLVWISQFAKLEFGDLPKTAIILAPLILYLLVTGKVSEFEGLGWKAKFREVVTENVVDTARASDLMISNPEANKPNFFREAFWLSCRPYYVLTDRTAKSAKDELDQEAVINVATAIRSSIICGRFEGVVIVGDDEKPVGFFQLAQFLEILRIPLVTYNNANPPSAESVYNQIMSSELGVVLSNPVIRAKSNEAEHLSVSSNADIQKVYKSLVASDANVAMITDRLGRFDGIITRRALEGRIIEKLLASSK